MSLGIVACFEERSDAHKADLIVPHDGVSFVRLVGQTESVLKDWNESVWIVQLPRQVRLTLKGLTTGLVRESLLLAVVGDVTDEITDQTLIPAIREDAKAVVLLCQLLSFSLTEHGTTIADLERGVVDLASSWVAIEHGSILGDLLAKACCGSTGSGDLWWRTGRDGRCLTGRCGGERRAQGREWGQDAWRWWSVEER